MLLLHATKKEQEVSMARQLSGIWLHHDVLFDKSVYKISVAKYTGLPLRGAIHIPCSRGVFYRRLQGCRSVASIRIVGWWLMDYVWICCFFTCFQRNGWGVCSQHVEVTPSCACSGRPPTRVIGLESMEAASQACDIVKQLNLLDC